MLKEIGIVVGVGAAAVAGYFGIKALRKPADGRPSAAERMETERQIAKSEGTPFMVRWWSNNDAFEIDRDGFTIVGSYATAKQAEKEMGRVARNRLKDGERIIVEVYDFNMDKAYLSMST